MATSTAIQDPALVLNASYEPLCVVSGRRAAVLVLTAKAVPVAAGEATAPPDYEHYVTQQLRPIADALLHFVGADDFDTIAGIQRPEGRQLALFAEGELS